MNPRASTTAEKDGKKVTVTSIDSSKIKTSKELGKGQVVAVLDVEGIPELPNGRYNVFVAKIGGHWQAFFESGGKIVKRDETIEVSSKSPNQHQAGTEPVIVMAPVDPRICVWFHSHWVCFVLNPFHWVSTK